MAGNYYVYIMASPSRALYVGVTNDLARRVYQHRHRLHDGFTARYSINRLVYLEHATEVNAAIKREKQIKGWSRKKKTDLIERDNPGWLDLAEELFPGLAKGEPPASSSEPATC
ncbi:MAG: GIY-YIG nuclease family protein [Gemmatimonadetes bacterium]|nr:GIY-YIG nuclease family protein [Gemmatimonadota bacterium]